MSEVQIERNPDGRGYLLTTEMRIPHPRDEVFEFFGDAFQLQRITPPQLDFSVLTPAPIEMREGTLIDYRLKIWGVPLRWRTKITQWQPPFRFVDEQLKGPYWFWKHLHRFEEDGQGRTRMWDEVRYAPIGGWLSQKLLVRRDLERIFTYRRETLTKIFSADDWRLSLGEMPEPGS